VPFSCPQCARFEREILVLRGRTLTDRISAQFPFPACRVSGLCVLTDV
jgi:hypothetical protein